MPQMRSPVTVHSPGDLAQHEFDLYPDASRPSISQDVFLHKPPECTSASLLRFHEGGILASKPPALPPRHLLREGLFLSSGSENRHLC